MALDYLTLRSSATTTSNVRVISCSTLTGSSLVGSSLGQFPTALGVSTLVGSTVTASGVTAGSLGASTLTGSTVTASGVTAGSLGVSTLTGSTVTASGVTTGSLGVSTLTGSTVTASGVTTTTLSVTSTMISIGPSTQSTMVGASQGSYAPGSWQLTKSGLTNTRKVATSSTGQYQIVVSEATNGLWLSSDSGVTWSALGASQGLPVLEGSAYWSAGSISASGKDVMLAVYGGSLWYSTDYGRTFSTTSQTTPDVWLPLDGSTTDLMGASTVTATGSPTYVAFGQPGFTERAINLVNTAGGTASQYVRGTWAGSPNFTVSFWFNAQSVNGTEQQIFSTYISSVGVYIKTTNQLEFRIASGGGYNFVLIPTTYTISSNTWYYVTIIYQTNNTCSVYVNNTQIGSLTNTGGNGLYSSSGYFALGTRDNDPILAFNGLIADFRLYNSAVPYVSVPHLAPNYWLRMEGSVADAGSYSMVNAATPFVYLPFEGSLADSQGNSTVTQPGGAVSYVPAGAKGVPGTQAVSLVNTAGGTADRYVRGTLNTPSNLTASFWFNPQTINGTQQIVFDTPVGITVYIGTPNQLYYQIPSGGGTGVITVTQTSFTLSANTWYFVTIIFQTNGLCSMYVNNTLIGSANNTGGYGTLSSSGSFSFGTYSNLTVGAFNGYIDDFRLWNTAFVQTPAAPATPTIYLPFEGSVADERGFSTVTATGSPGYTDVVRVGSLGIRSLNLVNTAGGTATQYVKGTWSGAANFTVSGWFNLQSTPSVGNHAIFTAYVAAFYILVNTSNQIVVRIPSGGTDGLAVIGTSSAISLNTWYYYTFIFQSNGLCSFYLNNSLLFTYTNVGGVGTYTTTQFGIGCNDVGTANALNGYIDDFRLWNSAVPYTPVAIVQPTGTMKYVPGAVGQTALDFAQVSGGMATTTLVSGHSSDTNITVSLWCNVQKWFGGDYQTIFSMRSQSLFIGTADDLRQIYCGIPTGSGTTNNSYVINNVMLNTWYHLVLIFKINGLCSFYANGILLGSFTNSGGWGTTANTGIFRLSGNDTNANKGFSGYIDDFRLYNAAIPYSSLFPANYTHLALSGNAVYRMASHALASQSGRLLLSSDSGATWTVQNTAATPGAWSSLSSSYSGQYLTAQSQPVVQPNQSNLASATWSQQGVTYTASASSIYAANAAAYFAFDNTLTGTSSWVSGATPVYSGSTGAYSGNVTTTIQGVGAYTGEWIQLQTSVPLVLQSYRYASGSNAGVLLPKIYFIVASNDGSTWYPLQSTTTTVKPITATWTVCSNNILINYTGTQIVQGNQTGSAITTSYPLYTSQTFQYFRMIINNIWTTGDNSVEIGEFIPNFLGGSITPNLSGLGANTWSNSGVSWVASASSNFAAGYPAYNAFDSANVSWASASTYNTTTGIYTGSVSTTIQNIGLIPGEWLQLQTSLPLVLQSYGFGCLEPKLNPKKYYIIGSNNGSTWYPLQYVEFTTIPFTSTGRNSSTNIIINYSGTQTIQGDQTGSATTTSYAPYVIQAFQYFRIIGVSIWESSPYPNMEYREFLPVFTAGQNSSTNYGLTWTPMIQSGSITNEFINDQVALSDSGQYTLFTQQVPPYSRLPLDNSNVDPHGRLTPTTGAGTVTYSSSIVKVGTHSAFFNNTSGAAPSVYLNYTVPAALNKPNQFTMACWTYLTALPGIANATPIGFIDTAGNYGLEFYISPTGTINFYGATTTNGIVNLMTSSTLQINTWSHLVMTYNSQTITLYYNGVSIGSTSATGALQSTGSANLTNLLIGTAVTSSNGLAGYVDDVRIYTTALSATEVLAVYNNPALTQTVGIASNYLPISSYTKPILSGITGSVVDTAVSQTGREMVLVTSSRLNNLYYSTDFGATFTGLNIGSSALPSGAIPLARLSLDGTAVDVQQALTPATGLGSVTYSSSIVKVGTRSALFSNTAGGSVTNYLSYTVPPSLGNPSVLTMACWVYPLSYGTNSIVICAFNSGNYSAGIATSLGITTGGLFQGYYYSTTNTEGNGINAGTVPLNTWTHVAIVFGGGSFSTYVNGVLAGTIAATGNLCTFSSTAHTNFLVGTWTPSGSTYNFAYNGYVDDVRIYNTALSAADILALSNNAPALANDQSWPMVSCAISNDGSYLTATNSAGAVYRLNSNSTGYSVAVGSEAGAINQAANAIAIGNKAGQVNQSANSIVLNATGSALNTGSSGFYVAPISTTSGLNMELLGYGADSQIVRSGVTVLPSSSNPGRVAMNLDVGGSLSNPFIGRSLIIGNQHDADKRDAVSFGRADGTLGAGPPVNSEFLGMKCVVDTAANCGYGFYNNQTYLGFHTWGNNYTYSREVMRIRGDGNVGIGTTRPSSTLECFQPGFESVTLTRSGASTNYGVGMSFSLIDGTTGFRGNYARIFGGSSGNTATSLQTQAYGYFTVDLANAGVFASDTNSANSQFVLNYNRAWFNVNVGIGTTSPTQRLDVAGSINCTGLLVNGVAVATGTGSVWSVSGSNISYTSGYVGIGTGSPASRLEVISTESWTGKIMVRNTAAGENYAMFALHNDGPNGCYWFLNSTARSADGGPNVATMRNDTGDLRLQAGSPPSEASGIRIKTTSNNVGIGTTNPLCTLYNYGLGTTGWKGMSYFGNETTGVVIGTYNNVAYMGAHNAALNAWTDITIAAGGNVGIGTNPGMKFDVYGNSRITTSGTAGTARTILTLNTPDSQVGTTLHLDFSHSNTVTGRITSIYEAGAQLGMAFSAYNSSLSERMRIRADGNIGIGTTNPGYLLSLYSLSPGILFTSSSYLSNPWYLFIGTSNGALYLGPNTSSGTPGCNVPIGGSAWQATSDARLKRNVTPIEGSLSRLMGLKPVMFQFKTDSEEETPREGFLAQEVQSVFPSKWIVNGNGMPSKQYDDDGNEYDALALCQTNLIPHLVRGIQELKSENDGLKATLADRSAQLDALMAWAKSQGFAG